MSPAGQRPSQLGLARARDELSELVRRVSEGDEVIHLSRRGRPVAILTSPERLASLEGSAADFGRLAEASQTLITTLEVRTALHRLVRVVTGWIGDVCIVDLLEDGTWTCVAAAQSEAGQRADCTTLEALVGNHTQDEPVLPGPRRITTDDTPATRWTKMLAAVGSREGVVTPLTRGGRVLGALMVTSATGIDERVLRLADEVARRASVVVDNARLYAEQRTVAERFQSYLLADLPNVNGLRLAARYAPAPRAAEVGGDWYDAFVLPDGSLALVIGDVMGHDLDAAAQMSQLRNLLRAVAWQQPDGPATMIAELDRISFGLGLAPAALSSLIVATLSRSDAGEWRLRWANAGHLPPALAVGDAEPVFLERHSEPLLCIAPSSPRTTHEMTLKAPATLVLYTDGLVERRSETLERSMTRLRRSVHQLRVEDPQQLCDGLIAKVADHDDDIALLAVRIES